MEPWIIIVMLGAAALVYAVMLPTRQVGKMSSEQVIKEVESTLEQYMADIEEENDTLVELVGQMKKDTSVKHLAMEEQLSEMRQRLLQVEQYSAQQGARITDAESQVTALAEVRSVEVSSITEVPVIEHEQSDVVSEPVNSIKHRYSELFELHNQGKSIDIIGKSVGLQRGEVQLILQLAKQEESL
ncbi:hypothetical protein [Paenibacillus glacialis]|uniref:Uncharacterized protein n=1 Tax=Paenibacillus glacialis TaxID=494026 RepID=A0A162MAY8_9BACL|nr:hypothetical protein [Paenibacillus glacialis]OAB41363.1 hypothetical protein PGLA_16275 [Paenibacillus glacialis]